MTTLAIEQTTREVLYQIEGTDAPMTAEYTDADGGVKYREIWGLGESTVCDTCDEDVWEGVLLLDGGEFWCEDCFANAFEIAEEFVDDPLF